MGYFYIFGCILFTVSGQLVLKWRMNLISLLPESGLFKKAFFLIKLILTDVWVFSGFLAAFAASLFWMAAMTKFSISFAYPFMSLAFVFVMIGSAIFLGENLSFQKVCGTLIIMLGLIVISRSVS